MTKEQAIEITESIGIGGGKYDKDGTKEYWEQYYAKKEQALKDAIGTERYTEKQNEAIQWLSTHI